MENKAAQVAPTNCHYLQQVLRYEREILEMQIVLDGKLVCSSLGNVINRPIVDLGKLTDEPQSMELVPMPRSQATSIAVINRRVLNDQVYHAVSLLALDYMRASLGYRTEPRLKSAALFIGDQSTPSDSVRNDGFFAYTARTDIPGQEIQLIASNELIKEKGWFYFLAAIPSTLTAYMALFYIRRLLSQSSGIYSDVENAVKHKQFVLHYQPEFNVVSGKVSGVEALVRWNHPERGLVYPDVFIPILDECGLINSLTDIVIDKAMSDFSEVSLSRPFHLGINFPPDYFLVKERCEKLIAHAEQFKANGITLGVEITERQLLSRQAKSAISHLRSNGIEILIDDFGTGQTSLSMLESTPIDCLKIDKCFVDSIGHDSVNVPVLDAIISMAQSLNLSLIAEGVEQLEQANYLKAKGVVVQQGYFYGKPMEITALKLSE
ncbi:EAL domain-containing protein [Vibrio variabilis]|uniref:EAL domain-containing protein n=1 Tax=Vibrio variabilis TaxID=990271 RepID=UPI0013A6BCE7|nr:EAL domain-containing protein [Vibrio variabilis]